MSRTGRVAFLVHNEGDHVGVAVADVDPGHAQLAYMDTDRDDSIDVRQPIPLGHKVALIDLAADADVVEYGVRIGKTRSAIARGELVHVHNIRSARWTTSA
jgi:(2R)-sulfolactate sulfo-lyase subunit alpha